MGVLEKVKECAEDKTNSKKIRQVFIDEFLKNKDKFYNLLYVDVPFCKQRCGYCTYSKQVGYKEKDIKKYIENDITGQINNYKEIFDNVDFDMIYFGGGTPNAIDTEFMKKLYETIPNFSNINYKITELHPALITEKQLELLNTYKFNCVSCGIQSLNAEILEKYNRIPFLREDVKQLTKKFEEMGIFYNYDLITYLNTGEIKDIDELQKELYYLCSEIKVKCITIHYFFQNKKTLEKIQKFVYTIKEICEKYQYECVNSKLKDIDIDIAIAMPDRLFELKIVRKDVLHEFIPTHVTFELNCNGMPGMNVLSIGFNKYPTWSYSGNLLYVDKMGKIEIRDNFKAIEYIDFIYFNQILKEKNIKFPAK